MNKRVIIADDHTIMTEGLVMLLKNIDGYDVVKIAHDGEEVIEYLSNNPADLILMDINMPKLDGIEATEIIKSKYPKTKILILSMHDKEGYIKNAIQAGADGYVLKNTDKEELILAIEFLIAGKTYFSQEVTSKLVSKLRMNEPNQGIMLSKRERAILQLLSDGYTSSEIAKKITASRHTVETYRKNLLIKFDARNVSELVKKSINTGFID
ncbi:MAG: response regulator transcription factor [Cyclobacteriaceae bacterium]|nr:response regulator transcription factor [Cyclobacteriaceae bacterium]